MAVAIGGGGYGRAGEDGVVVRITKPVVESFCDEVFPLKLSGKKRVSISVLGKEVSQDVPWTATVSSPRIMITRGEQTFVAKVDAKTSSVPAVTWSDEVTGKLDVAYDAKRKSVVIKVEDVVAPVAMGPVRLELDLAKDIPELAFKLQLPDIAIPNQGKSVRVDLDPDITFDDDAIVVTGTPRFRGSKTARKDDRDDR